jgi:hypothetical protein
MLAAVDTQIKFNVNKISLYYSTAKIKKYTVIFVKLIF